MNEKLKDLDKQNKNVSEENKILTKEIEKLSYELGELTSLTTKVCGHTFFSLTNTKCSRPEVYNL